MGSLTGAVASQRVTEARNGGLRLIGNQPSSVKAKARLTVRQTSRTGTKVGLSDPVVLHGRAIAQRIKGTPGITGLSLPRVNLWAPPSRKGWVNCDSNRGNPNYSQCIWAIPRVRKFSFIELDL